MKPNTSANPAYLYPSHTTNSTSVFVTGFGKFGSHEVNPTE